MTENAEGAKQKHFECPFCPCVFLTETDLKKHIGCMGDRREEHVDSYRRTHGRIEHGSHSSE